MPDSRERTFELELDHDTAELTSPAEPIRPPGPSSASISAPAARSTWREISHCPAALHLATVIDGFTDLVSYDKVRVAVETR